MVLCFAILLVKAMQLRSLVSVGLGGTIPHVNQMVSLIFMLLVQVPILPKVTNFRNYKYL
jgi:membrane protein YdbS with pleckstrin-like domain